MEGITNFAHKNRNILWLGLAVLFVLAMSLNRFATWNWGVEVSDDSIFYISAAENFLKGDGISRIGGGNAIKPLTHFPPLYPLSLSFLGYFIGVREAVDWWAAIFLGINTVLITLLIFQGTKSTGASLLGGMLAIVSPLLLSTHFEAMSEPLYLSSTLASFLLLAGYLRNRKNWYLIVAAVAASFAYLTRYIGVSVLLTGLLSLLFLYPGLYRTRFKKAVLFGTVAFIPNLLWYLRNYLLTGSFTNRVLSFHPVSQDKVNEGLLSISEWIFPQTMPNGLRLGLVSIILLIAIGGFVVEFVDRTKVGSSGDMDKRNPVPILVALHVGVYGGLLITSLTFFDISTRLNNRILIPLYVMFLILGVISIHRILTLGTFPLRKILYLACALLFTAVMLVYAFRSWDLVRVMRETGSGYSSAAWRNSEVIAILKGLDSEWIVYSNEAFPVYYLTGMGAYGIPEKYDPVKSEEREDFQSSMMVMRERLKSLNSALVVFHQGYLREGMPTLDEIAEGFVIARESRDGVIFVDPGNLDYWESN